MTPKFRKGDIVKLRSDISENGELGIVLKLTRLDSFKANDINEYLIRHGVIIETISECFIERKATDSEAMLWKLENV